LALMNAEAQAAAAQETLIVPPARWGLIDLRELWEHRELIYFLTKREWQIRYKQSFFGVGWAVLQPLAIGLVFAAFLGQVIKAPSGDFPYPVFVIAGLVPWIFLSGTVTNSAVGLVNDANLISKVYFPRLAIPLAKSLGLIIDLAIAMVVVVAIAIPWGVDVQATFYLTPLFLLLGVVTAFSLGALFAAINVKYRDVALIVPMLLQIGMFLTPIFYEESAVVSGGWKYVYALNPMVSVIEGVRWSLLGAAAPEGSTVAISVASAIVLLIVTLAYFRRTEDYFADIV
jgi:homopolymeric O-antigen transport system permease protein